MKDPVVADDILQETFMRIWIYRDRLAYVESPRAWVLKVVYNRVFTYKGGETKYLEHLQRAGEGQESLTMETEERLAYRSLRMLLHEAVSQLPPQQKKIYQLSREGGLSPQQMADTLNLSVQTVKNTLSRALQSIRAHIVAAGYPLFLFFLFSISF